MSNTEKSPPEMAIDFNLQWAEETLAKILIAKLPGWNEATREERTAFAQDCAKAVIGSYWELGISLSKKT